MSTSTGVIANAASTATTTGPSNNNDNSPPPINMTAQVGGRLFEPALPVVDGACPSPLELAFQKTLEQYTDAHIPIESKEGIQLRERVLNQLGAICRAWIQDVARQQGVPADVATRAGGQLYTSGSYRLGVHEPGADIDTILVAPNFCQKQDFFGNNIVSSDSDTPQRDPNSLAERIRKHPHVSNFVPVEGAVVPLLTFDWEGINIDLLFARLNSKTVAHDFDINNDSVLDGVDTATEKSLNGPRVTNLIAALVSGTPQRYQNFLAVVRCIRQWAKKRGLYKNVMGYWGGVNINIGVALVVQLYPNACPASLLRKFFLVFSSWRWPQPVLLNKPHDAGYGLSVWNAQTALRQVAPMITPAYPAMNSTLSISRQTLQILQEEFNRGLAIVDGLWKSFQKNPHQEINWNPLFEPSDFFIAYPVRCTVMTLLLLLGCIVLRSNWLFVPRSIIFHYAL
jgi:poly(A) polymerase